MGKLPSGLLTFCLTDIEGSTALWERVPRSMSACLVRHTAIVRAAVEEYGGVLVQSQGEGDSTLSVFVSPAGAVRATEAIHAALRAEAWPEDIVILVRIGMHTGDAELRDGAYYGAALSRAARVRAVASGGQTLLSRATAELVRDALPEECSLAPLGAWQLKGFARSEEIHCLVGPRLTPDTALPVSPGDDVAPGNLPAVLSTFLGRTAELAAGEAALDSSRLVTLTGPGGSGKTRIAFELAGRRQYRDGAWFVDLAPLEDPSTLAATVARSLAIADESKDTATSDPLQRLQLRLRASDRLLLLDNCEHVTDACAALVSQLLTSCPHIQVLTTSQRPLGVDGERLLEVPPLSLGPGQRATMGTLVSVQDAEASEAVAFLLDRARTAGSPIELTKDNAGDLVALCLSLDGMPLALELASAHLRHLTPAGLLERLGVDRFAVLRQGAGSKVERHRAMAAAVDWSYALLEEAERALLQRLSVFTGGFSLQAAEQVCADEALPRQAVYDILAALVTKSFVACRQQGPTTRFWLLETIRQYSWEQWTRPVAQAPMPATTPADGATAETVPVLATLRRDGRIWALLMPSGTAHLPHAKGFDYLATLLRHPDVEHLALDLVRIAGRGPLNGRSGRGALEDGLNPPSGHAGEHLDEVAVAAYRRRVAELRDEIEDAREVGHDHRVERLQSELEAVARELSRGLGLDGRRRVAGSDAERARSSATKAVKSAIARIEEVSPEAGAHLRATVRTGAYCSYSPPAQRIVVTDL